MPLNVSTSAALTISVKASSSMSLGTLSTMSCDDTKMEGVAVGAGTAFVGAGTGAGVAGVATGAGVGSFGATTGDGVGSLLTTKGQFMPSFDFTSSPGPLYFVTRGTGVAASQKVWEEVSRPSFQQFEGIVMGSEVVKTPLSSFDEKRSSAS
jgi:hypothetical protein